MIYLIGGTPRAGKSILAQQLAAQMRIGWISTDLLSDLLRFKNVAGTKTEWNAAPEAVAAAAEWFYPCLERFVWGVQSMTEHYVIEGVDFLPEHVLRLAGRFPIRSVFLGSSQMTLDRFDRYPGRSRGYAGLPEDVRRQFAQDVAQWSRFVQQEAERFNCPYLDMSADFAQRLKEAEAILLRPA